MPLTPEDIEALDLVALDPADPADGAVLQEAAVYYAEQTDALEVTAFREKLAVARSRNAPALAGRSSHRAARR